jgi:hypothetical protein
MARLSEPLISHVDVWKQLHVNQWFFKTSHQRAWKSSFIIVKLKNNHYIYDRTFNQTPVSSPPASK